MMRWVLLVESVLLALIAFFAMAFSFHPEPPSAPTETAHLVRGWLLARPSSFLASLLVIYLIWRLIRFFGVGNRDEHLRMVFLNRYAMLLAALHVGLVPVALYAAPGLLRGLLAIGGPFQMFNLAWLSGLTAYGVLLATTVTEDNAPARYFGQTGAPPARNPMAPGWDLVRWSVWLALSFPLLYACLRVSILERGQGVCEMWLGLGAGLVFSLALLALGQVLDAWLVPGELRGNNLFPFPSFDGRIRPNTILHPLFDALQRVMLNFGQGFGTPGGRLAPGHAQVSMVLCIGLAVYFGNYAFVLLRGYGPDGSSPYPPVFFGLMVLLLAGMLLSGLAFWLDRYQFSPLLAMLIFSFVMYQINQTDHFFSLGNNPKAKSAAETTPMLGQAIKARKGEKAIPRGRDGKRTLVCITAAGGGIQASAWATRVLTGLHEEYGEDFTKSVTVISAVSGGSVGTMFYLDAWDEKNPGSFRAGALDQGRGGRPSPDSIQGRATASSLEATAWGIAFPDFMRIVFPPLVSVADDRGTRIEQDWRRRLTRCQDKKEWIMQDLGKEAQKGNMPLAIFNATIAETGQRMLLAPFLTRKGSQAPRSTDARELLELYPQSRLPVSTAARLSATFSYVSPICRPWPQEGVPPPGDCYHFCDGGYVDNEGMVTLAEILQLLMKEDVLPETDRLALFDRVLIIRIQPFPTTSAPAPARAGSGWLYATLGPIEAVTEVRVASQAERNTVGVDLLIRAACDTGLEIDSTELVFDSREVVPLSWLLTDIHKDRIQQEWRRIVDGTGLDTVDKYFKRLNPKKSIP